MEVWGMVRDGDNPDHFIHNTITDYYREARANWLIGGTAPLPTFIAIGLGTLSPSSGDKALENEVLRKSIFARTLRGVHTAKFNTTFSINEPPVPPGSVEQTFTEVGLFDTGTVQLSNDSFEDWAGTPSLPSNWSFLGGTAPASKVADPYDRDYACLLTYGTANTRIYQDCASYLTYAGNSMTFRAPVKCNTGSIARLFIEDGVGSAASSYHTGDLTYQRLTVNLTMSTAPTRLRIGMEVISSGSALIDWPRLTQDGNLWARGLISLDKSDSRPLNVIWEFYFADQDEEGNVPYSAFAAEELTVGIAAISLTGSVYAPTGFTPAQKAEITCEDENIRYWKSGTIPTATSGHLFANSQTPLILETFQDIENFKCVRSGTLDAHIKVTYSR